MIKIRYLTSVVPTKVATQAKPSARGYSWIPDPLFRGDKFYGDDNRRLGCHVIWTLSLVSCLLLTACFLLTSDFCLLSSDPLSLESWNPRILEPYDLSFSEHIVRLRRSQSITYP